jgi:hypothetical protein
MTIGRPPIGANALQATPAASATGSGPGRFPARIIAVNGDVGPKDIFEMLCVVVFDKFGLI